MDQPKIERMLRLMQLLSGNVNYTVEDLMERLNLSRRTIYRYFDTFKAAGYAIQRINEGVYRMAMSRSGYPDLSKLVYFSEEEAYVVNRLIDNLDNTNAMKQGLKRKLAAVYDATSIGNYIDNKGNSAAIAAISAAIREKKTVLLHRYASAHSGKTKDYRVEPFRFNSNYIDIWAYDTNDGLNKRFKIARIEEVEILTVPWQFEKMHEAEPMDAFRIHSPKSFSIKLRLSLRAKNLLLEEYPLAEKELYQTDGNWYWAGEVRGLEGVGRFVQGLPYDVEVLEGEALIDLLGQAAEYNLIRYGK